MYGQGFAVPVVIYLADYLHVLQVNVCCINQFGVEPLYAASGMDAGDLLLCVGLPPHRHVTLELLSFAREREVCTAVISEGHDSVLAKYADISLAVEGDWGFGGSLAPLISLCSMIICILVKNHYRGSVKLKNFIDTIEYRMEQPL